MSHDGPTVVTRSDYRQVLRHPTHGPVGAFAAVVLYALVNPGAARVPRPSGGRTPAASRRAPPEASDPPRSRSTARRKSAHQGEVSFDSRERLPVRASLRVS